MQSAVYTIFTVAGAMAGIRKNRPMFLCGARKLSPPRDVKKRLVLTDPGEK